MNFPRSKSVFISVSILAALTVIGLSPTTSAQTTLSTGSIQGTVTDPSGAVLSGVKVTITNKANGRSFTANTNGAGLYTSGALTPGDYVARAQAQGFKSAELPVTIQVGVTATGNFRLTVGQSSETVEVQGSSVSVNTEQATVQGVLTSQQIENLPINGRNFLDLAQLEPGVQIQEGSTFDPTKNGFSSISFQGRFGRTARIEIDGVDISDETVGTTTQNIPASAIEEFQISQSSLDLSTELTSSGAVNVTTRSGTNSVHGEAFGVFRGNQTAAALPGTPSPTFQRDQFGGRVGGYLIKDKLFWFVDAERSKQDLTAAQPFTSPFDTLPTALVEPFRETQLDGRLDWQIRGSAHMFYRFNFDQNSQIRPFGSASSLQGFKNFNHTPSHTVGLDFNTGSLTHSIRFSLLEFRNSIVDGTNVIAPGIDNPFPGLGINIGASVVGSCVLSGGGSYCAGPNLLAPQATPQSNHQIKYDGSKVVSNHVFRYGVAFNHIQGGGFAGFFSFPQVGTVFANPGQSNPTSYPIQFAFLGNGIGFSTPFSAFGYPGGGLGPDNRFETYFGDNWKIRPNLSLTYGLHYVHDTGRVDSDLGPLPALNMWGGGLGNRVRTPGTNLGPQLGLAWDVGGNGKTVLRAGGGLYFENSIWNNVFFDSPARSPKGTFAATPLVCVGGPNVGPGFPWPSDPGPINTPIAGGAGISNGDGTVSATFCNQTIAAGGASVLALSDAFKAAAAAHPPTPQPNGNYVGTALNAANLNGFDIFDPNYRTPRSWQMNLGFQHQFRPGLVFSADFIRNIGEHFLIVVDRNHSGAARSFSLANALAARNVAQASVGTLNGGFTPCAAGPGQATCVINANATLVNNNGTLVPTCVGGGAPPCSATLGMAGAQAQYSAAGLDSNLATTGGAPCNFCAFPGTNPVSGNAGVVGTLDMLSPVGRSVYNGLQLKLVQNINSPVRAVKAANFQVSYALSRFVSQVQDQDFVTIATNNDNPTQFTGPDGLDRRHQISFGGTFDLPFFTRLSVIGHFYSALPQNLLLPQLTSGGEIYASDWLGSGLGSGLAGEPVPGTNIGQFERGTNAGNLQNLINNYNGKFAGTLTPAGNQLVNNNVMTNADMSALGWVMPQLGSVPAGARDFGWLKGFDFRAAWPIKVTERLRVEPSVSIFNIFNFSNAFLGGNLPLSSLVPSDPGCVATNTCASTPLASNVVGGVTQAQILPFRATFQSGTYALGAPRQIEFGLKIDF